MGRPYQRQPLIKEINRECIDEVISTNKKYNTKYGFLHIPKTGGSSIMRFFEQNHEFIKEMPVPLFHSWNLELIHSYFPSMKLVFAIRDPLERTISGFQSRLRMGTPDYYVPWSGPEATSFGMYRCPEEFLDGLLEDSDYHVSATTYALESIIAISWNYAYYFKDVETLNAHIHMLGPITNVSYLNQYLEHLINVSIIQLQDPGQAQGILSRLQQAHKSQQSSKDFLQKYSQDEINRMKARLHDEYEIYEALKNAATRSN